MCTSLILFMGMVVSVYGHGGWTVYVHIIGTVHGMAFGALFNMNSDMGH
jgi:hypothetical protein